MFIAHLPAGYLLGRALLATAPLRRLPSEERRALLRASLVASVLPDADLLWFYLGSDRSIGHHGFVTHTPVFWLVIASVWALLAWAAEEPRWRRLNLIVLAGVLLHLALDTVASPIRWLYPVSGQYFTLFPVPRLPGPWFLSFLRHWTVVVELVITLTAWAAWRRSDRGARWGDARMTA